MKRIFATLLVLAAAPAFAGSAGAGPAGTGSSVAGSVVVPRSEDGAATPHAPRPGSTGTVALSQAQSSAVAQYLKSQPDATVSDTQISAPTTLADGTAGRITLDTRSGALTLTRL